MRAGAGPYASRMAARSRFEPDAVASASFAVTRRGYDTDEVRTYLRALADEVARLRTECDELRADLARPKEVAPLDPAAVATALGEEAARLLTTARDASAQIRARSEEAAATLVDDANRDALRIREQADLDAARLREQAQTDADAEIEDAKAQGREMVSEARAVRERMLADVQRRKEQARAQLEQLRLGHERVLGTFELATDALASITNELRALAPDVRRTCAIDTGPVPAVPAPVPDTDVVGIAVPPDEPEPPHRSAAPPVVQVSVPQPQPEPAEIAVDDGAVYDVEEEPSSGPGLVSAFSIGEVMAEPDAVPGLELEPEPDAPALPSTDDLFARIRAARTADADELPAREPVRSSVLVAPGADDVSEMIAVRDGALAPVEAAVARRMKRALADEQNEVLDRLRRKNPVLTLDGLVGTTDEHAVAYQRVVRDEMRRAIVAGARSLRPELDEDECLRLAGDSVVERLAADARDELIVPLRDRLARLLDRTDDASTVTDGVRTLYREWKTQKLDEIARHLVVAAHGRAAYAVLAPGTATCWIVDPGHPCPDGEDNALAGPTDAGQVFPTGHLQTPAYVGCRCALAPTAR